MATTHARNAKRIKTPTYRLRPDYGQAIVTLTDAVTDRRKVYWLGVYDTPAHHEMFRLVAAHGESKGRRLFPPEEVPTSKANQLTINKVTLACKRFVEKHYKRASQQTIRFMPSIAGS